MNRTIQFLAVLTIAVLPGLSGAYMEVLTRTYELGVDEITLPAHAAGQAVFKPCEECESVIRRVDGDTTYHVGVGSPAVSLKDLLGAVDDDLGTLVLVDVDATTDIVARIILDTGE